MGKADGNGVGTPFEGALFVMMLATSLRAVLGGWCDVSLDAVELKVTKKTKETIWMRRQQQRAANAKYSPVQEAARAAAADQIKQQRRGGDLASAVQGAFSGAMDAAGAHVGPGADGSTEVGFPPLGLPEIMAQPLTV